MLQQVRAHAVGTAQTVGRDANLEDEIRSAMTLAAGLEVLGRSDDVAAIEEAIESAMGRLLDGVQQFEHALWHEHIAASVKAKRVAESALRFVTPFVSRPVQRDRLHLFTTNYDRLLEYTADLVGLRLIDRFDGQLHPRFSASRLNVDVHYSPPGVRGEPRLMDGVVRFSKLHGSVD